MVSEPFSALFFFSKIFVAETNFKFFYPLRPVKGFDTPPPLNANESEK